MAYSVIIMVALWASRSRGEKSGRKKMKREEGQLWGKKD